jgi:hypothetical protein
MAIAKGDISQGTRVSSVSGLWSVHSNHLIFSDCYLCRLSMATLVMQIRLIGANPMQMLLGSMA